VSDQNEESDFELFLRVREDSIDAYETLYRRYGSRLYRVAYLRLGSTQLAEEVAADTLFLLWRKRGAISIPEGASLYPWLFVCCGNLCFNASKSRIRYHQLLSEMIDNAATIGTESSAMFADKTTTADIVIALTGLSLADREIILLRVVEDLSYDEVASILGVSQSTARTRLSRAMGRLRSVAVSPNVEFRSHVPRGESF